MFTVSLLLSNPLAYVFVGYDLTLIKLTVHAFLIYAPSFLFSGFTIFISSLFTALNDGLVSAAVSFVRTLIFQVATVLLLPLLIGIDGIWWSFAVAEVLAFAVSFSLLQEDLAQYKVDMQEAFQLGAKESGYSECSEQILPEKDINDSLLKKDAVAYKAALGNKIVGGAIITVNKIEQYGYLDFLYVKHGMQGQGIGKFMWFSIESLYPDITVWKTCTPYFEKRNIHFYVNKCGFHIVEFFGDFHADPNEQNIDKDGGPDEMFRFIKVMDTKL